MQIDVDDFAPHSICSFAWNDERLPGQHGNQKLVIHVLVPASGNTVVLGGGTLSDRPAPRGASDEADIPVEPQIPAAGRGAVRDRDWGCYDTVRGCFLYDAEQHRVSQQ